MEPYRSALAGRQPQTLRACGGYLGPGLFLVAGCRKGAIALVVLVPIRTPKIPDTGVHQIGWTPSEPETPPVRLPLCRLGKIRTMSGLITTVEVTLLPVSFHTA